MTQDRPANFVLFLTDDQGYGDLSNHRAAGFHSVAAFIAMAMLCVGGFAPVLPHQ